MLFLGTIQLEKDEFEVFKSFNHSSTSAVSHSMTSISSTCLIRAQTEGDLSHQIVNVFVVSNPKTTTTSIRDQK